MIDTDKGAYRFFSACSTAGPTKCPLYESTPEAVHARVNRILESVRQHPIYARSASTPSSYGFVDYSRVKIAIFTALYSPFKLLPTLAKALAALEGGDGSLLLDLRKPDHVSCPKCTRQDSVASSMFSYTGDESVQLSILCGESELTQNSPEDIWKTYEDMSELSEFADKYVSILLYGMFCRSSKLSSF